MIYKLYASQKGFLTKKETQLVMKSEDYYNEISEGYDELHSEEQLNKANIIAEELELDKTIKLLDVGCESGVSMKPFNCEKIGVDNSEDLLSLNPYPSVKADAEDLPFDNDSFEVVICVTALHNFNDFEKSLSEMIRVSKRHVVISLLKKAQSFKEIKKLISEKFKVNKVVSESKDEIFFLSLK